jgi:hypothetical protein
MVNSSWTAAHIQSLWWAGRSPTLVYPPCDTEELQQLPLDRPLKHLYLVSGRGREEGALGRGPLGRGCCRPLVAPSGRAGSFGA